MFPDFQKASYRKFVMVIQLYFNLESLKSWKAGSVSSRLKTIRFMTQELLIFPVQRQEKTQREAGKQDEFSSTQPFGLFSFSINFMCDIHIGKKFAFGVYKF